MRDELCMCGHRKSQHEDNVCGWWNCKCKQFEPLSAEKPKREQQPSQELPRADDIIRADVAAHDVISADVVPQQVISAEVAPQEVISTDVFAQEVISEDVAIQAVEQLRSKLRAAEEEIGRLKELQDGNYVLATRLSAENNQLREALAEIKRLVDTMLPRP